MNEYPFERIGEEKGEWFERYVEAIFKFANFATERDRIFPMAVRHEIDIFAEAEFGTVAVECKDWRYMSIAELKKELDAFATKVRQIGAKTGVFAVNIPDNGRFQKYRDYMKSERLSFWDTRDIERWYERIGKHKDKASYSKELCDSLGIQIRPLTGAEKTSKFLKKAGGFSFRAAKVGLKIVDDLTSEPKRHRRRRSSKMG